MRNQHGFTLIELLVVLVIIGIVLRFVVPPAQHFRLTLVQGRAKEMVIEDLRAARQRAITRHVPVIVAFGNGVTTINLTSYKVHADTNGDRLVTAGELVFSKNLPRDSKLAMVALTPTDTLMYDVSGTLKTGTGGGKVVITTGILTDTLAVSVAGIVYEP